MIHERCNFKAFVNFFSQVKEQHLKEIYKSDKHGRIHFEGKVQHWLSSNERIII